MSGLGWCRAWVRSIAVLFLISVISGCVATRAPVVLTASFDAQAAAFINAGGRAKVSGQAFVRHNSGKMWRAVGTNVYLIPRTAYADERIAAIFGDGKEGLMASPVSDPDPLYERYMRKTVASSGGSFSFDRVADGEYYVIAMIHIPSDYQFYQFPILERVSIHGGRSVRLVMRGY